jgi:hypothetical protein
MGTAINVAIEAGIPLEISHIFTPLGIHFQDLTQNLAVTDGLVVTLQPLNGSGPVVPAVTTDSGVYTFFELPGLRAAEYPDGAGQSGPPRTFSYVVSVRDTLGRYLPEVLVYTLDQTGALLVNGIRDTTRGAKLAYLFSAPTRTVLPGVAGVRAYLIDQGANAPAAWAMLRVQIVGQAEVWTGIADERGQALVLTPYPVADRLRLGSPPGTGQGNITGQSWPVTVQAFYSPANLTFPLGSASPPSLKGILEDQQPATIWSTPTSPVAQFSANLTLGQDLVLRSAAASPPSLSSSLNISQGISPP